MRRTLFLGWLITACATAHAASLQISQVMIELRANENAYGITLRNPGEQPLYGQVRVFRWDQSVDDDALTPTQDLMASPPILQIAAQGEQQVRLIRRDAQPVTAEQSYRILIDEIPPPETAAINGVNIRLRYSVPVFVEPPGAPGQPILSWQVLRDDRGWLLRVSNTGSRRGQIGTVQLTTAAGKTYTVGKGLLGYALPGRTRQWKVDVDEGADMRGTLKLRAYVNALPLEALVSIDPRL
ncbi:molecular chaperone [Dyella tabacisoli]|uniref:Molecular chaperone n=1 Tax=Dyella tabacisoli TaxID=2282381 RepID=A0A369ULC0_9GAMM|nr:molecular chaperone [Dyella tabacisoli]RDD80518.1 molecular chaperone [Dyella tabacisoli]